MTGFLWPVIAIGVGAWVLAHGPRASHLGGFVAEIALAQLFARRRLRGCRRSELGAVLEHAHERGW